MQGEREIGYQERELLMGRRQEEEEVRGRSRLLDALSLLLDCLAA